MYIRILCETVKEKPLGWFYFHTFHQEEISTKEYLENVYHVHWDVFFEIKIQPIGVAEFNLFQNRAYKVGQWVELGLGRMFEISWPSPTQPDLTPGASL
jgi:hypothetical protein